MSGLSLAVGLFLLLTVAAGLVRLALGPTAFDRMLAVQLFGTTGTAVLLLLADAAAVAALRDVALAAALLASISTVVFVRRGPLAAHFENEETG